MSDAPPIWHHDPIGCDAGGERLTLCGITINCNVRKLHSAATKSGVTCKKCRARLRRLGLLPSTAKGPLK